MQNRGMTGSGEQECPIATEEGYCFCGKFCSGKVIRRAEMDEVQKGLSKSARAASADGNLIATGAQIAIVAALAFIRRMSIKDGFVHIVFLGQTDCGISELTSRNMHV